jgi:hypothetical protein
VRFLAAASFGAGGEFAAFALAAMTLPDVDLHGPVDGLMANLLATTLLSDAVFAVAGGFRVVEAAGVAVFFAVTLAADDLLRPAAGFVGGEASAISRPNTSATSASSSTLPVVGRFLDLGRPAPT